MTEKTIQEDVQSTIRGMAEFTYSSVAINDWRVKDGPVSEAPYLIILTGMD